MISQRLLDTLQTTNRDLYPAIYNIICILLTKPVSSPTSEKSFSAIGREILLKVDYWR